MYSTIEKIKEQGFTGFIFVKDLRNNHSILPKIKGVYMVINTAPKDKSFLQIGTGGFFKGKNPNINVAELNQNWIENTLVMYIGQAGGNCSANTLAKRIKQYLDFGNGKNVGHYGGRLIWQIAENENLLFAWKELINENPSDVELNLLVEFSKYYGKLPFANLRF